MTTASQTTPDEILARFDRVLAETVAPLADRVSRESRHPAEAMKAFSDAGLMGMLIPVEHGGLGTSNLTLSRAMMRLARVCASTAVTYSVHNSLCSACVVKHGTADQKSRYLPRLARGELLGAYSLTESHSGSDAAALRCRAVKKGDAYRVTGTKAFVTNGADADFFIVFVRTLETDKPSKGISALLVERTYPGFRVGKKEKKTGITGSQCVELVFEDCPVPAANLLGECNKGFSIAMAALDGGRIGIASQAVGIAEAAFADAVQIARDLADPDPYGDREMVDFRLADMATRIDASRLLVERAASMRDAGTPHSREAAMAKLFASQTADEATREAVAIAGPAGLSGGHRVERYLRDARITELYEGTTEIQKLVISRQILAG